MLTISDQLIQISIITALPIADCTQSQIDAYQKTIDAIIAFTELTDILTIARLFSEEIAEFPHLYA